MLEVDGWWSGTYVILGNNSLSAYEQNFEYIHKHESTRTCTHTNSSTNTHNTITNPTRATFSRLARMISVATCSTTSLIVRYMYKRTCTLVMQSRMHTHILCAHARARTHVMLCVSAEACYTRYTCYILS
jgi:hypothetical protein